MEDVVKIEVRTEDGLLFSEEMDSQEWLDRLKLEKIEEAEYNINIPMVTTVPLELATKILLDIYSQLPIEEQRPFLEKVRAKISSEVI